MSYLVLNRNNYIVTLYPIVCLSDVTEKKTNILLPSLHMQTAAG